MLTSDGDRSTIQTSSVSSIEAHLDAAPDSSEWTSFRVSILITITCIAVPLNTCTIILLWKIKCLPNIINAIILNLSFVDLIACLYLPYHVTLLLNPVWFTCRTGCLPGHMILQLKCIVTVTLLLYTAIDQSILSHCNNLVYRGWTQKPKIYIIMTLVWIISSTLSIGVPFVVSVKHAHNSKQKCYTENLLKHWYLYGMLLYIAIHIIVALLLLLSIATKYACCQSFKPMNTVVDQRRNNLQGLFNESRTRNAQRVYILSVTLTIMFTLCVSINLLASLFNLALDRDGRTTHTEDVGFLLISFHACLSPLLCIIRMRSIRRAYCRMLRGDCGGRRHSLARTIDSVHLYGMSFNTNVTGVVLNMQTRIRNMEAQ